MDNNTTPVRETVMSICAWWVSLHGMAPTPTAQYETVHLLAAKARDEGVKASIDEGNLTAFRNALADCYIALVATAQTKESAQQGYDAIIDKLANDAHLSPRPLKDAPFGALVGVSDAMVRYSGILMAMDGRLFDVLAEPIATRLSSCMAGFVAALAAFSKAAGGNLLDDVQARMATNRELSGIPA